MCGITGILSIDPALITGERLKKMADAIAHRGPDGEGFWTNPTGSIGMGHRRLSIIDLSDAAAQPMHYVDRYTIIHNGELYNYIELKKVLAEDGYAFRSQSDTEVILAAYDKYGEACLQYFDGMYAFAIWDEKDQTLFCARDRFGEKPFYYYMDEVQFCFASERKSLWAGGIAKKINNPLMLNFLAAGFSTTPADATITFHQDIFSLPPAHYIKLHLPSFSFSMNRYWDGDKETRSPISEPDAIEELTRLLLLSVKRRLRSDVPTGTSLSGGLDSTVIVNTIRKLQLPGEVLETFSAVFPGFEKNESAYIDLAAKKFNLESRKVTPSADDFIKNFEKLCYHQEEPFTSSSVYAQFKVFELAGTHGIKVLLDGQGADETLAGYPRYIPWYLQEVLKTAPRQFSSEMRAFKKQNIPFHWSWKNYAAAYFPLQVPGYLHKREAKKTLHQPDVTDSFKKQFFDRASIYKPLVLNLNDILYFSTFQFGLEELLRVADRNSMAHGREVRLPFLHHELVTFVGTLPARFKMREGWTKWILRKCAENDLPPEIVWRKDKVAYETPQKTWMETAVVKDYLHEAKKKLIKEKILKPAVLDKKNQPQDTFAADNSDWRYLVAASFL